MEGNHLKIQGLYISHGKNSIDNHFPSNCLTIGLCFASSSFLVLIARGTECRVGWGPCCGPGSSQCGTQPCTKISTSSAKPETINFDIKQGRNMAREAGPILDLFDFEWYVFNLS